MTRENLNLAPEILGGPVASGDLDELDGLFWETVQRRADDLQARLSARWCRARNLAQEARENGDPKASLRFLAAATHLRFFQRHGKSVRKAGGVWTR